MDVNLPMFLNFEIENGAEDALSTSPLRGKPAAEAYFEKVSKFNDAPTLSDLEPLVTFDWLISREQNSRVQQWLQQIWTSAGMAGSAAANKRSSPSQPSSSSSKKARTTTTTTAEQDHTTNVANLLA